MNAHYPPAALRNGQRAALRLALAGCAVLAASCANQMHPSGGPVDTSAPVVRLCTPESGSVNVPRRLRATVVFSEWIEPRSAEKSVTVFPAPLDGYKVTVKGRRIEISSKSALAESTTYHIEIGAALQDLHGMSIGTPFHFVFSTGPILDRAKVYGCVVAGQGKKGQPKVALFSRDSLGPGDTVLLSTPTYLMQTDTFGRFELSHIRPGHYDILAFIDADNNNRLTSAHEQAFAPVEKRFRLDSAAGPLTLYPVTCDSSVKRIASLRPQSATVVIGRWENGTRTDDPLLFDSSWVIVPVDTADSAALPPPFIADYTPIANSLRFVLTLSSPMRMIPYYLIYTPQSPMVHHTAAGTLRDTIRFNGTASADTTPPSIISREPSGIVPLKPRIALAWSEPVRARSLVWFVADSLGDTTVCTCESLFTDTTVFTLSRRLLPGRRYRLTITDTLFADMAGNAAHDTAAGFIQFTTVAEENLCFSLSGSSTCLSGDAARVWQFMPLGVKAVYSCPDNNAAFRFDSIPAGKGILGYFIDANGDGRPNEGRLFPWRPPEVVVTLPDTLEARARWDIEGIRVTGCGACPPATPAAPHGAAAPLRPHGKEKENDLKNE